MAFDDSLTTPLTAHDLAIEAEKRRKIREYQARFTDPLTRCLHCQRDLDVAEYRTPLYRGMGRICTTCREMLAEWLEPEEEA